MSDVDKVEAALAYDIDTPVEIIEDAHTALASLARDAARYRWLRQQTHCARSETAMDRWHGYMWGINGINDPHHEGFDTAVDTAMQRGQEHTK